MVSSGLSERPEVQEFYKVLERQKLVPGWTRGQRDTPRSYSVPYLWRWADLEPLVWRAGELLTHGTEVERRILHLANPALEARPGTVGHPGTSHTMAAYVQLLLPGEVAPAHRHTPTAIRWVLQGQGAYTTIEGDRCLMERGDLVLTPAWTWHDHAHDGDEPMIWMDGLDTPLVRSLESVFNEVYSEDQHPVTKGINDSLRKYGDGALRPAWEVHHDPWSPLLHFKWEQTRRALDQLSQVEASPYDDVALEYTNPSTGGTVLDTMACWIQLVRAGARTRAHRHTSSAVYQVFEGQGYTVIDGQRFDWVKGDFFVVPSWAWHEHVNETGDEAVLFSIQDIPIMRAAGLYREEAYQEHGGHQPLTGVFTGAE